MSTKRTSVIAALVFIGAAASAGLTQDALVIVGARPEKGNPQTFVAHPGDVLRMMFPFREMMLRGGDPSVRPRSYNGHVLQHQPLRVMRTAEDTPGTIVLGADELGETTVYFALERKPDGGYAARSLVGAPGSEWILPTDIWIVVGDIKVKGFRIRCLASDYEWHDPQEAEAKKEIVKHVIQVEVQNVDSKRPGELVYVSSTGDETAYCLAEAKGIFVFSDLLAPTRELVQLRGWRTTGTMPNLTK